VALYTLFFKTFQKCVSHAPLVLPRLISLVTPPQFLFAMAMALFDNQLRCYKHMFVTGCFHIMTEKAVRLSVRNRSHLGAAAISFYQNSPVSIQMYLIVSLLHILRVAWQNPG
jgi:hypothetical protein